MPERQGSGAVLDDLPDGVIVADEVGVVVTVNDAAARILGAARESLIGRELAAALPLVDRQGRDWWDCTKPYGGLVTRVRQPERQLTLTRPDGSEQGLLVTASYVRDGDRHVTSVVVCLRDVLARDRHERSGVELIAVVAHELRSPLTSVKGFTATLLNKWERFTDEQKLHMLHTINADADRLTRLISELLDVSRIETGRLELRKQVVDLAALVGNEVRARVAAGESADRFVLTVDEVLPELWADPDKLAQVVGNIVENALRHGAGTVRLTVGTSDGAASVEISDEGDGIAELALPRIFNKFWHDASRGGSGLGLFIAKGIIDAHGGTIDASNTAAGGAVVRFTLPAAIPSFAE